MTYSEVSGSGLLYALVIAALLFVALLCAAFYGKARRQALALGIPKEKLNSINKSTALLTIVPSLTIVVGLLSLAALIGVPWAWFRLSVIGSVMYELIAAQMATAGVGITDMAQVATAGASVFGAVMFVMSIGIVLPPIINAVVSKSLSQGLQKAGNSGSFGPILSACFMLAMYSVCIPIQAANGIVNILVMITSCAFAWLISFIATHTKAKWLSQFSLSLCLLLGMASSVLWTSLFA